MFPFIQNFQISNFRMDIPEWYKKKRLPSYIPFFFFSSLFLNFFSFFYWWNGHFFIPGNPSGRVLAFVLTVFFENKLFNEIHVEKINQENRFHASLHLVLLHSKLQEFLGLSNPSAASHLTQNSIKEFWLSYIKSIISKK